jgi:hypothetical protein
MAKRRSSKKRGSKKRNMSHLNAWRSHLAECHKNMGGKSKVSLKEAMKRCSKTYKKSGSKKSGSKKSGSKRSSRKKSKRSKRR